MPQLLFVRDRNGSRAFAICGRSTCERHDLSVEVRRAGRIQEEKSGTAKRRRAALRCTEHRSGPPKCTNVQVCKSLANRRLCLRYSFSLTLYCKDVALFASNGYRLNGRDVLLMVVRNVFAWRRVDQSIGSLGAWFTYNTDIFQHTNTFMKAIN